MQKCVVNFLVKFWLKIEDLVGKIWWNFGGRLFYLPGKHLKFRDEFRGKFRRKFRKLRSKFRVFFWKLCSAESIVKQRGRERRGPQKSSRNFVSETGRFRVQIPYDSYGRDRAPFWPFFGAAFWGNIRRPLVLPAPLVYCWQKCVNFLPTIFNHLFFTCSAFFDLFNLFHLFGAMARMTPVMGQGDLRFWGARLFRIRCFFLVAPCDWEFNRGRGRGWESRPLSCLCFVLVLQAF